MPGHFIRCRDGEGGGWVGAPAVLFASNSEVITGPNAEMLEKQLSANADNEELAVFVGGVGGAGDVVGKTVFLDSTVVLAGDERNSENLHTRDRVRGGGGDVDVIELVADGCDVASWTIQEGNGLTIVENVRTSTRCIPIERATLKVEGTAASADNINCPSFAGNSIVNKRNQDKVGDGVIHKQPSTITTIISISTSDR